jgi:methylase of polypeptide subunit release factors
MSSEEYSNLTKKLLIDKCKSLHIKGYSNKTKEEIINLLKRNKPTKLNVLDLFCGCGGMSKGLHDAGLNIVAGIDIWDVAIESYSKNFEHLSICADLKEFNPEKLKERIGDVKIDIIVG